MHHKVGKYGGKNVWQQWIDWLKFGELVALILMIALHLIFVHVPFLSLQIVLIQILEPNGENLLKILVIPNSVPLACLAPLGCNCMQVFAANQESRMQVFLQ